MAFGTEASIYFTISTPCTVTYQHRRVEHRNLFILLTFVKEICEYSLARHGACGALSMVKLHTKLVEKCDPSCLRNCAHIKKYAHVKVTTIS